MYFYFFILISFIYSYQFQGLVVNTKNEPISSVNIELIDYNYGVATDQNGYYSINDIDENQIRIKLSHIGYYEKIISQDRKLNNFIIILDEKVDNLDEITITGLRREIYIKDSPILTRVINSQDIEESSYSNVKDILEMSIPNIQNVISSHAGISNNNLKIQGLDSRHMLFLIDGTRVSGEFAGNLDFNMLDLSNVERIEIVEGGMSSLYGSSAIGGVVNIITKNNKKPFTVKFSYMDESPMITTKSLNIGYKNKLFDYSINLLQQNTDGYSLSPREENMIGAIYKTQEEYISNSISHKLKFEKKHNNSKKSILSLNYKEYINTIFQYENHRVMILDQDNPLYPEFLYQSPINNTPRFKDFRYGLSYELKFLQSSLKVLFNSEDYRKYNFFFNYEEIPCDQYGINCNTDDTLIEKEILNASNKNQNFLIQFNRVYKNHDFIFGFETNEDKYSSFNVYRYDDNNDNSCGIDINGDGIPDFEKDCWSQSVFNIDDTKFYNRTAFFMSDQISFNNNNKLNMSLRHSDSKNFGNGIVYSTSFINKNILPHYNFRLNFSKGFRIPSIKELYYNFQTHPPPIIGNVNLKPTTNYYYSISLDEIEINQNFSIELFYNDIIDMIGVISIENEFNEEILQYSNYNNVILKGFNFHFEQSIFNDNKYKIFYNYTLPSSNNNSAIELISKNTMRVSFNNNLSKKIKLISNIKYSSTKNVYIGSEKIKLDDITMVEIIGLININKNLSFKIGIKNLLDYKDSRRLLDTNQEILSSYDPGKRIFLQIDLKY